MTSKPVPQTIFQETSIIEIWNDLQPLKTYYPLSSLIPSIFVVISFTFIHYLLDKLFHSNAVRYAQSQVPITKPKWIESKTTQYRSLRYDNLTNRSKKQLSNDIKKYELTTEESKELIHYHTQCIKYQKHVSKFQEALFKVIVFGFVYFYGLALLWVDAKWFWNQQWMWSQPLPQSPGNNPIFNLDIYYFLQIGYHGHRALYQFSEHKRKDFVAMFIHHWITVFLLIGSKVVGHQQIGATVLLCNDNLDLLLPLAKISKYAGYNTLRKIFSTAFLSLWIPLRIGVFFYKVLWAVATDGYVEHWRPYLWHWIIISGLWVIYLLQFYWGFIIMKMICTISLKGQGVKDTRSDDEQK